MRGTTIEETATRDRYGRRFGRDEEDRVAEDRDVVYHDRDVGDRDEEVSDVVDRVEDLDVVVRKAVKWWIMTWESASDMDGCEEEDHVVVDREEEDRNGEVRDEDGREVEDRNVVEVRDRKECYIMKGREMKKQVDWIFFAWKISPKF